MLIFKKKKRFYNITHKKIKQKTKLFNIQFKICFCFVFVIIIYKKYLIKNI